MGFFRKTEERHRLQERMGRVPCYSCGVPGIFCSALMADKKGFVKLRYVCEKCSKQADYACSLTPIIQIVCSPWHYPDEVFEQWLRGELK